MKFDIGTPIQLPIDGKITPGMVMGYGRSGLTYIIKHDAYECAVEYTKDLIEQFAFVSQMSTKLSFKEQREEEDNALRIIAYEIAKDPLPSEEEMRERILKSWRQG